MLMNERQAAEYLNLKVGTLQNWRSKAMGPNYLKMEGWAIRYKKSDLDAYLDVSYVETPDQ